MQTLKTTLRTYHFDMREPDQKAAWETLRAKLSAQGMPHCHGPILSDVYFFYRDLDGQTIELETAHLFNNQWNTAPIAGVSDKGLRVFDWALNSHLGGCNTDKDNAPSYIRRGHYLEQTREMLSLRDNVNGCGYCGKQQPAAKGDVFCPHCIGSEYLKATELHLLRMLPMRQDNIRRLPLSEAESAHLLPLYRAAQSYGATERDKTRLAKLRADIIATRDKTIKKAEIEYRGRMWLMDNGAPFSDPIFYSHTGRWGFGWREPLDADHVSQLLNIISEFPFPYDIKCADGRTLSGN